jgi:hypothetical protein
MPTSANTPDQRSDRYARYIQVGPTPATHLSRWVHPNGTTKSHPPPSIVKALTPSQLADTPSSPYPTTTLIWEGPAMLLPRRWHRLPVFAAGLMLWMGLLSSVSAYVD